MEFEVTEQEDTISISIKGSIFSKPDSIHPFTLFYALNLNQLSYDLLINRSGLWAINTQDLIGKQNFPLVLHDSVFSLELKSEDKFNSSSSLGVGRGFLILDQRSDLQAH